MSDSSSTLELAGHTYTGEELAAMSEEELVALCEQDVEALDGDSEKISEKLQTIEDFVDAYREAANELDDVIDSGSASANATTTLETLNDIIDTLEDLPDLYEEGKTEYNNLHIELSENESVTLPSDDDIETGTTIEVTYADGSQVIVDDSWTIEQGSEEPMILRCVSKDDPTKFFYIQLTASEETSATFEDPHSDLYDSNDDGVGDMPVTLNAEGHVEQDLNNDGAINSTDDDLWLHRGETPPLTVVGTVENPDMMSEAFQRMIYPTTETVGTGYSYYYLVPEHADETPVGTAITYEQIDLSDAAYANAYSDEPTATDFANNVEYYIDCTAGVSDTLNFDFEDGDVVKFTRDENGDLVMTVTREGVGTVTYHLKNLETQEFADGAATGTPDVITINGGTIDEASFSALNYNPNEPDKIPVVDDPNTTKNENTTNYALWASSTYAGIITHNGTGIISEAVQDYQYNWNTGVENYTGQNVTVSASSAEEYTLTWPDEVPEALRSLIEENMSALTSTEQADLQDYINNTLPGLLEKINELVAVGDFSTVLNKINKIKDEFKKYFGSDSNVTNTGIMHKLNNWLDPFYEQAQLQALAGTNSNATAVQELDDDDDNGDDSTGSA